MALDLIKKVKELLGTEVNYLPHDIRDVLVLYSVPPVPVRGLEYVAAWYSTPQTRLVMGLTGNGVYINNNNKSGIIEFATITGTVTGAGVQVAELTGIPFPIVITDKSSGGTSSVAALSCRLITTPEWRRAALPGVDVFTFAAERLEISTGVRLADS